MSALYTSTGLITNRVTVTRQKNVNKIVSTLLDGSEHVQIIGEPTTRLHIELFVDITGRNEIDSIDSQGDLIRVIDEEDNEFNGRILSKEYWQKLIKGHYKTNIIVGVV